MKVTLITCTWKRYEMTRAFWIWAAWLRDYWAAQGVTLTLAAAVSEDDHAELAQSYGVDVVRHENNPLGAKFNAAMKHARPHEPDYVLIMGSDDLFCGRVADALIEPARASHPSIGLRDLYFADLATGRVGYWKGYKQAHRLGEPAGCGRLVHRDVLDRSNWTLWEPDIHRGMDHSSFKMLKVTGGWPVHLVTVREIGGTAVDCKTADNLWRFENIGCPAIPHKLAVAMWERLPFDVVAALPSARVALAASA